MKKVQDAIRPTGLPAFAGIWRPTTANAQPPVQYLVYSTLTVEDEHYDDAPARCKTLVYLNLWSLHDVTDAARNVRAAMRQAGFSMIEETDKGYNQNAYSADANLFTVNWTWVTWEAITDEL